MDLAAGLNHASRVVDEQPRGTEGSSVSDLWRREAKELETASLWWVAPDMTTLAADTGPRHYCPNDSLATLTRR